MIDPDNITNYEMNDFELEEFFLFWVLVAGKSAKLIARAMDKVISEGEGSSPFSAIENLKSKLPEILKKYGIGCFNFKAKALLALVESKLNLRTCSVDDLESIYGIGPKTARCMLLHSRPNMRIAGLDTHILKYLGEQGFAVPKSTPVGKKYKILEIEFLKLADKAKKNPADFDLEIWRRYRQPA